MIIWAESSVGTHTPTNQDSVFAELLHDQRFGRMVFAVVADGMGGMDRGELASATAVDRFVTWLRRADLSELTPGWLRREWGEIASQTHQSMLAYAGREGIALGSTVTVLLLAQGRYHIMNLGDTRCYEITDRIRQITEDHSLVAQEVRRGLLSPDEARADARQNVLLQCLGAGGAIKPDFFVGEAPTDAKYLLCTDGLRHYISDDEIWQVLSRGTATPEQVKELIALNRQRGETDDISVVLVQNSPQGGTNKLAHAAAPGGSVTR
ncbi:MAG: protein phosphatase 2C domain-containing protein [Bifidobacteriaceae bacterium]|jgi:serine/threonine protein phosphatase PrpC|nr:protein phosphatase 2C domain-containing protein [Bifidobacteriaceae bacterium]